MTFSSTQEYILLCLCIARAKPILNIIANLTYLNSLVRARTDLMSSEVERMVNEPVERQSTCIWHKMLRINANQTHYWYCTEMGSRIQKLWTWYNKKLHAMHIKLKGTSYIVASSRASVQQVDKRMLSLAVDSQSTSNSPPSRIYIQTIKIAVKQQGSVKKLSKLLCWIKFLLNT